MNTIHPSLIGSLDYLPDLYHAAEQRENGLDYRWENAARSPESGFVIQQTLRGSMFFETGGDRRWVTAGQAALFQHGETSTYGLDASCDLPYHLRYIVISHTRGIAEIFDGMRTVFGPVVTLSEHGEAGVLLETLVRAFKGGHPPDRLSAADLISRLLMALHREQQNDEREADPIAHGRRMLEIHFRTPRNLSEWMASIGVTREHFSREFTRRHGETPARFLQRLRAQYARRLLHSVRSLTLEEIALQSGFSSTAALHRAFVRNFGSPAHRSNAGSAG